MTTLAGYIHHLLTGENIVGVGEASGMFPIDSKTGTYHALMQEKLEKILQVRFSLDWDLKSIFPGVRLAGESGGYLTEEGARFLDPTGNLMAGVPVAPPEGDAQTGMAATNSVRIHTGNVSAGTSDFAMVVTDHELGVHREIDMVTTPDGMPVAMVHCNNCTSDINAWVHLFYSLAQSIGSSISEKDLFVLLFQKAMDGEKDGGGLLSYNYFSGEGVTGLDSGRPVFLRTADAHLTLEDFMRTHIMSALATLKIGMDILTKEENVTIERLYGHGGFFKTPVVGQKILAAAVQAPVSVMETAGEGGPYGMALLAAYGIWKDSNERLEDFLDQKVFLHAASRTETADPADEAGFDAFLKKYKGAFSIEKEATECF